MTDFKGTPGTGSEASSSDGKTRAKTEIERLAKEKAVLHWTDGAIRSSRPWAEYWVDVYIPEICDPAELNWLFTIEPTNESGELLFDGCAVETDAFLKVFFLDESALYPDKIELYKNEEVLFIDWQEAYGISKATVDARPNDYYPWHRYKQEGKLGYTPNGVSYTYQVLSLEGIEDTISDWLRMFTDYEFELVFETDMSEPLIRIAKERMATMHSGETKTTLNDGVTAEPVIDLLNSIETTGETTSGFQELIQGLDEEK